MNFQSFFKGCALIGTLLLANHSFAGACGGAPGYPHPNGGGFVSLTAYVESSVQVDQFSVVCGSPTILGNVKLLNSSEVIGNVYINGNVTIDDSDIEGFAHLETETFDESISILRARVSEHAYLFGNVEVSSGNNVNDPTTHIKGHARVLGDSVVQTGSQVYGHAFVSNSIVSNNSLVHGWISVEAESTLDGAIVCDDFTIKNEEIGGDSWALCDSSYRFFGASSFSDKVVTNFNDTICFLGSLNSIDQGSIFCWGSGYGNSPILVDGISNATKVEVGLSDICAIFEDGVTPGQVSCWAKGDIPQLVSGLSNVVDLDMGHNHVCVISDDTVTRDTYCWGNNSSGQLGVGDNTDRETPTLVTPLSSSYLKLALGQNTTCAIVDTGDTRVECWGELDNGLDGSGVDTPSKTSNVPELVQNLSGISANGFKEIATTSRSVCALHDSSGYVCWGNSSQGQLANGDTSLNIYAPIVSDLDSGTNWKIIAGGDSYRIWENSQNIAGGWGRNTSNQIGVQNSGQNVSDPTPVFTNSTQIMFYGTTSKSSCILTAEKEIQCIGVGESGQLGNGENYSTNQGEQSFVSTEYIQ